MKRFLIGLGAGLAGLGLIALMAGIVFAVDGMLRAAGLIGH